MTASKNINIKVYLENDERHITDMMTIEEAREWVKKWMKSGDVYSVWDNDTQEEIGNYNRTF